MAHKIPVGSTISHAYGFAFGNIVNNLGVVWIPAAIMLALTYFFQQSYWHAIIAAGDPRTLVQSAPTMAAAAAIVFVLLTAQIAGLTREALGLRTGSAFLQFPFGGDTWRLIGSYLLFFLVICLIYLLIAIVAAVVGGVLGGALTAASGRDAGMAAAALTVGLVALAIVCAMIYIGARMSFLLPAVAVAEKRVSLIRAWQLTKGSFWRIFLVVLVLVIPFVVAEWVFMVYVLKISFAMPHPGMTPSEIQAAIEQRQAMNSRMMMDSQRYWYVYQPAGLFAGLLLYGMFAGAAAHAYRAVTHEDRVPEVF